jgi:hypothetical protein
MGYVATRASNADNMTNVPQDKSTFVGAHNLTQSHCWMMFR